MGQINKEENGRGRRVSDKSPIAGAPAAGDLAYNGDGHGRCCARPAAEEAARRRAGDLNCGYFANAFIMKISGDWCL